MQVLLGPVESAQMDSWLRFARRLLCDLRTEPGDMDGHSARSLLAEWCKLTDRWDRTLRSDSSEVFTWTGDLDPDRAEFLLHSLQRILHSDTVAGWVTQADLAANGVVTHHVMQRFIEALVDQGDAHEEYVEQLRAEVAAFAASLAG